jgi:UDP-N-acetylglucosamine:LPS N-acetylglucosamine transferase
MCTAGFESVCEAAFLGKAVLMVPLDGHHEQALNAVDAEQAGVAIAHRDFDLNALSRLPERVDHEWFRAWCLEADARLLETVERIAGRAASGSTPDREPLRTTAA